MSRIIGVEETNRTISDLTSGTSFDELLNIYGPAGVISAAQVDALRAANITIMETIQTGDFGDLTRYFVNGQPDNHEIVQLVISLIKPPAEKIMKSDEFARHRKVIDDTLSLFGKTPREEYFGAANLGVEIIMAGYNTASLYTDDPDEQRKFVHRSIAVFSYIARQSASTPKGNADDVMEYFIASKKDTIETRLVERKLLEFDVAQLKTTTEWYVNYASMRNPKFSRVTTNTYGRVLEALNNGDREAAVDFMLARSQLGYSSNPITEHLRHGVVMQALNTNIVEIDTEVRSYFDTPRFRFINPAAVKLLHNPDGEPLLIVRKLKNDTQVEIVKNEPMNIPKGTPIMWMKPSTRGFVPKFIALSDTDTDTTMCAGLKSLSETDGKLGEEFAHQQMNTIALTIELIGRILMKAKELNL